MHLQTTPYSELTLALQVADRATYRHGQRVGILAAILGAWMGFSGEALLQLRSAASLHDIGKLALPAGLLQKSASFDHEEYRQVQRHAAFGAFLLECTQIKGMLSQVARYHHERWDGLGYPFGLAGGRIPLAAQITCVADAYEAMTTDRPYRSALGHDLAMEEIHRGRCRQFGPETVDAFIQAEGQILTGMLGQEPPESRASEAA